MEGPTELKMDAFDFWGGFFLLRRPSMRMTAMVRSMPRTMPGTNPATTAPAGNCLHCAAELVELDPERAVFVGDAEVLVGDDVLLAVLEDLTAEEDVDEGACKTQSLFWHE